MSSEYGYPNLPLCVIDAVFSIGVRYSSVQNTVAKFCEFFKLLKFNDDRTPGSTKQLSMTSFLQMYSEYGLEAMTDQVYRNRQRTSSRNGILKSEAVLMFSQVLAAYGVEYLQDVEKILGNQHFEQEITQIPGQRSGISLRYFYMLAGSEDFIKPDRMINRFVYNATGKSFGIEATTQLLIATCQELADEYPGLTPRTLDHLIWRFQRSH